MAIKIKLEAVETELFCSSKWWRDPDLPADMEYPTAHATEDGMLNLIYKPSDFETGKWKLVRGVM